MLLGAFSDEAIALGNDLLSRGFFRHACNDHLLKNEKLFYNWTFDPNGNTSSNGSPRSVKVSRKNSKTAANKDDVVRVLLDKEQLNTVKTEMRQNLTVGPFGVQLRLSCH